MLNPIPSANRLLQRFSAVSALLVGTITGVVAQSAADPKIATPWIAENATRARLIAGPVGEAGKPKALFGGVEIHLDDGWKTYWRNPGSSGVPPRFEWTGSENLAAATPLFPAPERFPDREGDTIGYKKAVVLPFEVKPVDPKLPVRLKLSLEYGVCKDVCIPVQPTLELTLPPEALNGPTEQMLENALDQVPREPGQRKDDPKLDKVTIDTQSAKPSIVIDATFAPDARDADVFLEAPDGIWIPLTKAVEPGKGRQRKFHVDLTDGADIADLKGKSIRVTLRSNAGSTDTSFKFE